MKRNFLFMLLLTILPLVGWAQGPLPEELDLVYTGAEQPLVKEGGANWNQILFQVVKKVGSEDPQRVVWENTQDRPREIIDEIPTAKDPGTYYVFYAARQSQGGVTAARWNGTGDGYVNEGENKNRGVCIVTIKAELFIQPKTDVVMVYGTPFDLTASVFAMTPQEFNTPAVRDKVVEKLKVNEDLSEEGVGLKNFSLGLKTAGDNLVEVNYATYLISPLGGGKVNIQKDKNELIKIDGRYVFSLADGLAFNGSPQDLVVMPEPNDDETEAPKTTKYGTVQFFSINAEDWDAYLEEKGYVPGTNAALYIEDWGEPGVLPQGTEAGTYIVFAKAAASDNWDESAAEAVGEVTIAKGKATFEWTEEIAEQYFYNPNRVYKDAEAPKTYIITKNGAPIDLGTVVVTPTEAQDALYFGIEVSNDGGETWERPTELTTDYPFIAGKTYRVGPRTTKTDNVNASYAGNTVKKVFTVVKPGVKIKTTPATVTMGYGVNKPTFGVDEGTWEEYTEKYTKTGNITYQWYTDEECTIPATVDNQENYTVGTYYVKAVPESAFDTKNHELTAIVPAKVLVTMGEIVAKFEDQNLVYGETLPLHLTYVDGAYAAGSKEAENFNKFPFDEGQFKAKKIKDAEGKDVVGAQPIALEGWTDYRTVARIRFSVDRTTLLDAGTYEVTFEQAPGNNQIITNSKATWTIAPKDINETSGVNPRVDGFNNWSLTKTYTSKRVVPEERDFTGDFTLGFYTTLPIIDYDVKVASENLVYGRDFEVTNPGENLNAGTGTFTLAGKGNYTGTKDMTFTIKKATLYVKPKAGTWTIGQDEKYEVDRADIKAQLKETYKNDQNINQLMAPGFKDLYVKRIVGNTVGTHQKGLQAVAPEEAQNYVFNCDATAPLTINPGKINLKVKKVEVDYAGNYDFYKDADKKLKDSYSLELAEGTTFLGQESEASKILEENWQALVTGLDDVQFELQHNTADPYKAMKYNAGDYTITASLPTGKALTATNYAVEITGTTGTFTVNPYELTLKAPSDSKAYSQLTTNNVFDQAKFNAYKKSITTVIVDKKEQVNYDAITYLTLQPGDKKSDVVDHIEIGDFDFETFEPITVDVITKTNANYTYVVEPGEITIIANAGIELTSTMADVYRKDQWGDVITDENLKPDVEKKGDLTKLAENNNAPVTSVKLTLIAPKLVQNGVERAEYAKWEANQWHTLVLPFDVTARKLSYAFGGQGYVIVNLADSKATEVGNVKFALPEDIDQVIKANTPFCIKTADAYTYPITLNFTADINRGAPYKIVAPGENCIVMDEEFDNAWGYTFEGSYLDQEDFEINNTLSYLRFLGPKKWNFIKETSTNTQYFLPPYNGYVNLGEGFTGTREVVFTFEEEDGSTTDIKAVDFVNGNKSVEGLYNVQGMKVQDANQKGIYIQNGKKFVVK